MWASFNQHRPSSAWQPDDFHPVSVSEVSGFVEYLCLTLQNDLTVGLD